MLPSASTTAITLPALPGDVASVDICFDGVRVWSIDLADALPDEDGAYSWPQALAPYLVGSTELTIVDSGSGAEYARFEATFSADLQRTAVVDDDGIPLAVNKWGRLGKTLGAGNPGVQRRILERSTEIIEQLTAMGLRPFIVGGTLLGAVREGALLPHDDDADIAYLSLHRHPADVAREGFAVGHRLQELGYELVRHSATHMQLYFRDPSGSPDHYIDVFTAFYSADGLINQPFHVRGELPLEQMLPFSQVEIDGVPFPAPASPEAWLEINYDENWRTPIPGYQLHTPPATRRRFDAWFGSFHFQRDFWNDWYDAHGSTSDDLWWAGRDWAVAHTSHFTAPALLDLGSGSGALAALVKEQRPDRRVVAADFAHAAEALAQDRATTGVEFAHVNLYRTLSLSAPASLGFTGAFDVVANHLLEQTGHLARGNALRLIRMALRSGGSAVATLFGAPGRGHAFEDPTTWHLARHDLRREAKQLGLGVDFEPILSETTGRGPTPSDPDSPAAPEDRQPYGVRFRLSERPFPVKEESLRKRLKRLFLRARPQNSQEALETLSERVAELENELDEYRRDSLRVAELMDLVEQRFTPGQHRQNHTTPEDDTEGP